MAPGLKLLRFPELKALKGIPFSRRHIDRLEAEGAFPKRVSIGANAVMWVESEIDAHIAGLMEARFEKASNHQSSIDAAGARKKMRSRQKR